MPTDRNLTRAEVATYAEVLLSGAKSENAVFEVGAQLADVLDTVRGSMRLRDSLADPSLSSEARAGVVKELFKDFSPSLVSVLSVMVERNEIDLLARVNRAYSQLAEKELGAVVVDVTSAVSLDDHLREVIKSKLSRDLGSDILLREHVDKSILGGIIMSAHGKRLDASMATQLEHARVALSTERIGGDE